MNSFRHGGTIYILKNKDSDNIIENINKCDDVNNLLTIIDNVKENNNISNNDLLLIKSEYAKKNKELTNINLSSKELNGLFARNSYELKSDGLYYHYEKNGNQLSVRISGHIEIDAITRNQYNENYGIRLRFRTILGDIKISSLPRDIIFEKSGLLQRQLISQGFDIDTRFVRDFEHYINSQTECETVLYTTDKTGWYNANTFVLPHKTIGDGNCIFESSSNLSLAFSQEGSLDEWQQKVARYCADNPLLMLAVCSAFAGPLLSKVNMQGGGFHIFGNSSSGKSTISKVAASVYGKHSQYVKSWRTTTNGLEGIAAQFNDGLLILDEISQSNSDVSQSVYMMSNGQSKTRADKYGEARNVKIWKTFILSNGERTIAGHGAEFNKTIKAGVSLRLLDVPVTGKFGIFDNLHDIASGKELSDYLTSECDNNYGHAGTRFIEKLIQDDCNFTELFHGYQNYFVKQYSKKFMGSLSSQEQRALKFFALVAMAGELSIEYGISGWKETECIRLIFDCFINWKNINETHNVADIEKYQVFNAIRNFIDKHGNSRFMNVHEDTRIIHNQAGYIKKIDGEIHYLFNTSGFEEAIRGNDKNYAIKVLKETRWLICESGRNQNLHSINNIKSRFYDVVLQDLDR
jgi:putative DNA primase/helicase